MDTKKVRVGLVGFGTIGNGVAKIILESADAIEAKTGVRLELACVVDQNTTSPRPVKLPDGMLTSDINKILQDASISICVELIGGIDAARKIQLDMLKAGKDIVTANKALLATYGNELYEVAHQNNRCIAFEASCAGGIPIISEIRSSLTGDNIKAIYGILNGTSNYILSNMTNHGIAFQDALKAAQSKGYAEADPALDINGEDIAHKLVILGSIAFGYDIRLEDIYIEGIENISINDIRNAGEMGYILKLLAIAEKFDNGRVSLRVHPALIRKEKSLATVEGCFNAISLFGSAVGNIMLFGRGAGMMPTASAVIADIIDVALGKSKTTFDHLYLKPRSLVAPMIDRIDNLESRFYIRVMAKDVPGVMGQYSQILGSYQIGISGILQHEGKGPDNTVPVVITTHKTQQGKVSAALHDLGKLPTIGKKPVCIRIVDIPEDKD